MNTQAGTLAAPFPWFGGKSGAFEQVWEAFGIVDNYVEPFAGSAAMLLGAPPGKRIETINDFDGMVANFWRAIAADPDAVANSAGETLWCSPHCVPVSPVLDLFSDHAAVTSLAL